MLPAKIMSVTKKYVMATKKLCDTKKKYLC